MNSYSLLTTHFGHLSSAPDAAGAGDAGHKAAIDVALAEMNRKAHFAALIKWFEGRRRSRNVIIIPGQTEDLYAHFVYRLGIDDKLGLPMPRHDLGQLSWPVVKFDEVLEDLSSRLASALTLANTAERRTARAQFERTVKTTNGSIIFSQTLDSYCIDHLDTWLRYFTRECPVPKSGQLISVLHWPRYGRPLEGEEKSVDAAIKAAIGKAHDAADGVIVQLMELEHITEADVRDWARRVRIRRPFEPFGFAFNDLETKAFGRDRDVAAKERFAPVRERIVAHMMQNAAYPKSRFVFTER